MGASAISTLLTFVHSEDVATQTYTFQRAVDAHKNGESLCQVTQKLFLELSQDERLHLLDGDVPFYEGLRGILCDRYNRVPFVMGAVPRLEIPGIRFTDGPRGVVVGASTAFPVSMARGATWDIELERRIGNSIGLEAKAQGANFFAGVCVNLPRHPAWGRIQETYGEDPILLGEFGLALTQGVQEHVMACVKHFALNSMENARFRVNVKIEENVLHEVYLPHFRRIIEGGVAAVMASYNSVNGEWAGQSQLLLSETLRKLYNFDGFVISDFIFGLRDVALSLENGLDIEAPFKQQRDLHLREALASGEAEWWAVDLACLRILQKQIDFAARGSRLPPASIIFCNEHRTLAREAAGRSIVLLKNEVIDADAKPLLPLDTRTISRIGLVGRLANIPNTGDRGSSQVFSPHVVTPLEGLRTALPSCEVVFVDTDSTERASELAANVDIVICIVGYDAVDEGEYVVPSLQTDPSLLDLLPPPRTAEEIATLALICGEGSKRGDKSDSSLEVGTGGDRRSLTLRLEDVALIAAVRAANPRTVVSIIAAGAVIIEDWVDLVPSVVMSWYAGCEGGHGLADVLLGRIDASGRLPFSIPKNESHLPYYDIEAAEITYDRWHGQSLLDKIGQEARFPLGFGLSYTTFNISDLRIGTWVLDDPDRIIIQVNVANMGLYRGRHIVQVYGLTKIPDFPSRVLLGFMPVDLDLGGSKAIKIDVSTRPLQRWIAGKFVLPVEEVTIEVAAFSGDPNAMRRLVSL